MRFRSGMCIDNIETTYRDGVTLRHGGDGGGNTALNLDADENIIGVRVFRGKVVCRLEIYTNRVDRDGKYRFIDCGGREDWAVRNLTQLHIAPPGSFLVGISGRSGTLIDNIGFHWAAVVKEAVLYTDALYEGIGGSIGTVDLERETGYNIKREETSLTVESMKISIGGFLSDIEAHFNSDYQRQSFRRLHETETRADKLKLHVNMLKPAYVYQPRLEVTFTNDATCVIRASKVIQQNTPLREDMTVLHRAQHDPYRGF